MALRAHRLIGEAIELLGVASITLLHAGHGLREDEIISTGDTRAGS